LNTRAKNVITGVEIWVYVFTLKPNNANTGRVLIHLAPKRAQQVCLRVKATLLVFSDHRGIVRYEFAAEGQIINQEIYLAVPRRLRDAVQWNRPEMWTGAWLLHHDNAHTHTALSIRQFLESHSIHTLPQLPYSSDLFPPDFFYSLNSKLHLKE
jgi:hypothetical protein